MRIKPWADEQSEPKTLAQLNQFLQSFSKWTARRSPSGYYYFTHDSKAPTTGVYTFNLRGTTFAYWRSYHDELTAERD